MPNYFGKQRLVRILYNYLEWTAPEKLAELKRELKEAGEYRKYEIKYTKRRGDEWLKAHMVTSKNPQKYRPIEAFSIIGQILTCKQCFEKVTLP